MRLNNEKKIMLCQKSLYVKQLEYYSKLCEIYSNLAATQGPHISPDKLQSRYAEVLSDAARGDLSVFAQSDEGHYQYGEGYKTPKFTKREEDLIRDYAFASSRLGQFKVASAILSKSLVYDDDNSVSIDKDVIRDYHRYMDKTSKSTRLFDQTIAEHTTTFLGHEYYSRSRAAVQKIQAIDETHIENFRVNRTLTPAAFGANINGCRTRLEVINEAKRMDTRQEVAEYKEEPNLFGEVAYFSAVKAGQAIQRFHTNHREQIRAVFASCLIVGGIIAGAQHLGNAHEFNTLNISQAQEQGYQVNVSEETIAKINAIEAAIQAAKSSPTTPTYEELSQIREDLDNVIDNVMTDLVSEAFEEENPNCTVTSVDTRYDKTVNQGKSPNSEPAKENTVIITYIDENGDEQKVFVQDFSATSLLNNAIEVSFDNEYLLDNSHPSATVNQNQNFVANNQDVFASLDSFEAILGDVKHLAATDFTYSNGWLLADPSLKAGTPTRVEPDAPETTHNQDKDDDGR